MSNTVLPFHSEHLNFILHLSEFTRVWLIFFHNKSRSRTTYRNTTQLKPNICAFRSFHDRQIIFFVNNFNSSICWVKFVEVFLEWYTSPVSVTLVRIFGKIRNKRKIYIYVNIYRERITCTSICNHLKNTDIVTSLILPILPSSTLFWLRFFFLNTTSAFPFSHTLPRPQDSSGVKIQDGGEAVQSSLTPRKNNDNFCH